jgi:hypothetical protein
MTQNEVVWAIASWGARDGERIFVRKYAFRTHIQAADNCVHERIYPPIYLRPERVYKEKNNHSGCMPRWVV